MSKGTKHNHEPLIHITKRGKRFRGEGLGYSYFINRIFIARLLGSDYTSHTLQSYSGL